MVQTSETINIIKHSVLTLIINNFLMIKEGNVLFNYALNTFYLRLYDVRHMVKDH